MKNSVLDTATDFGLAAIGMRRNSDGDIRTITGDHTLTYHEEQIFPSLVMRALDSLPAGTTGDKVIMRLLSQLSIDRRCEALGKIGSKIPSNINVWHHAPGLVAALREVGSGGVDEIEA